MMRSLVVVTVLLLASGGTLHAQTARGTSNTISFEKKTVVITLAEELNVEFRLSEPSGNGALDAGEIGEANIEVKNFSSRDAHDISIRIEVLGSNPGIVIRPVAPVPLLVRGTTKGIRIEIEASGTVTSGQISLRVDCSDSTGSKFKYTEGQIRTLEVSGN